MKAVRVKKAILGVCFFWAWGLANRKILIPIRMQLRLL